MDNPTKEHWQELCKQAQRELDPNKLAVLVEEINRLLEEKEALLKGNIPTNGDSLESSTPFPRPGGIVAGK